MSALPGEHADWPSVVALGGGHGLSRTLRALRRLDVHVTAVVATCDDGGSTGRLRRDLGVLPPGDLRKALAALTPDRQLARLLEHRFPQGDVAGHTVGNLMLVGATELHDGDLVAALGAIGGWVGARGRVLPATTVPVELIAEGADGVIRGQDAVTRTSGHRRIRLAPDDAPATAAAVDAIREADLLVLGPGSLFTSILPNLVVSELADALTATATPIALVANLREQLGETAGMDLAAHVEVVHEHLPGRDLDVLVVHEGPAPGGGGAPLDPFTAHPHVKTVVTANLLDGRDGHDPDALAGVFERLLAR